MMTDDTRERLARLETQMQHVSKAVDDMGQEVKTLVDLLNQARGAQWTAKVLWGAFGGAIGAALIKFSATFFPVLPK